MGKAKSYGDHHGTVSSGTIVRVELFGVVVGEGSDNYEVVLYGRDGCRVTKEAVLVYPDEMFPCKKPPKLTNFGVDKDGNFVYQTVKGNKVHFSPTN